jgi:AraC family transcriptional regulator of adaptative response/methylated-DNA-[protein]-cysteine methyltransferase
MSTRDYQRIEQAIRYLEAHFREQPRLGDLAAQVGLSEYHFQRLFRRWAGVSPKRFLQFLTADYARPLVRASYSVLDAAHAAGLSGGGRLHDLMVKVHAVTPGELKNGGVDLVFTHGVHESHFGECLIALTDKGICALEFIAPGDGARRLRQLQRQWPAAVWRAQPPRTRRVVERLFTMPRAGAAPIDLFVHGSNFQVKVWEALLRIPPGRVSCYEDVARDIGAPTAVRAVAGAVARNPVAFLIPCHRVIRKTGAFGEYRWGSARKRAILGWEAARSVWRA